LRSRRERRARGRPASGCDPAASGGIRRQAR
jgi:hypothetical protein